MLLGTFAGFLASAIAGIALVLDQLGRDEVSGQKSVTRTDAAIVEAFRTTGQAVLTMPELSQALLAAGLAEPGVKTPVIGCTLLRRVSPGRYALAGAGTDPMTAVGGHR